jgi:hypothetical protein
LRWVGLGRLARPVIGKCQQPKPVTSIEDEPERRWVQLQDVDVRSLESVSDIPAFVGLL